MWNFFSKKRRAKGNGLFSSRYFEKLKETEATRRSDEHIQTERERIEVMVPQGEREKAHAQLDRKKMLVSEINESVTRIQYFLALDRHISVRCNAGHVFGCPVVVLRSNRVLKGFV